ncbi:MAG: polysaccharide biosynthesis protein [Microbacteriaceae bacterium]|nr:polysaccharide biosynthesis protein [Microbacteriaceae bacterium]
MSEAPPSAPQGARTLARRILAFAGVPFLSLLAPFLFLPVLARLAGADAWVAIALGQSVGGFAALIGGVGYPTLAPPQVALADAERRRRILATSLHVRVPVWVVAGAAGAAVAALLAPESHRVEAALMAVAISLAALAPTWFWIGVGRAAPILWSEVLPRMAATLAATLVLLAGGGVIWYPLLLMVAMIAGPAVVYALCAGSELVRVDRGEAGAVLRTHPPAVIAETAAGAYNALAVALVAGVTPVAQAARYVSGDKAYRIGQYAVTALGNALQGWVAEVSEQRAAFARRLRIAVLLHAGLGLVGLIAFAAVGPLLTEVLFGREVAIDRITALGFGVAALGIALGTACGRIGLVTLGARTAFMTCVLIAAVVGVAGLLLGGALAGAPGAAWGLGIAELASGIMQGVVLLALWRRRPAEAPR